MCQQIFMKRQRDNTIQTLNCKKPRKGYNSPSYRCTTINYRLPNDLDGLKLKAMEIRRQTGTKEVRKNSWRIAG